MRRRVSAAKSTRRFARDTRATTEMPRKGNDLVAAAVSAAILLLRSIPPFRRSCRASRAAEISVRSADYDYDHEHEHEQRAGMLRFGLRHSSFVIFLAYHFSPITNHPRLA